MGLMFYILSLLMLLSALKAVTGRHPVYGALFLALSMIFLAGIFYLLGAPFLAGVQLIIYAGAVIVLFVMVLMLFDFSKEKEKLLSPWFWVWPALLLGLVSGVICLMAFSTLPAKIENEELFSAKSLAQTLFTKYVLIFEVIGILLLAGAIGVTSLVRLNKEKNHVD